MLQNKVKIISIPDRFGLNEENNPIFQAIFRLIVESAKYALRMKPEDVEGDDQHNNSNKKVELIAEQRYGDTIEKYLRTI